MVVVVVVVVVVDVNVNVDVGAESGTLTRRDWKCAWASVKVNDHGGVHVHVHLHVNDHVNVNDYVDEFQAIPADSGVVRSHANVVVGTAP